MPTPQPEDWSSLLGGDERGEVLWELSNGFGESPEESVTTVDTDLAWAKFSDALPATAATPPHSRFRQNRSFQRRPVLRWVAIAAAAVGALLLVNVLSSGGDELQRFANADAEKAMPVVLADESTVMLSAGASLEFADGAERRDALLLGSATFEVERDEQRRFHLEGKEYEIVVMGTAFAVTTKHGETEIQVTEGHVRVRGKREADWVDLYAGDMAMVRESLVDEVMPRAETDRVLNVRDVSLSEFLQLIETNGLGLMNIPTKLEGCRISGDFTDRSLIEIAETVAVLFDAKLTQKAGVISLSGGRCQ